MACRGRRIGGYHNAFDSGPQTDAGGLPDMCRPSECTQTASMPCQTRPIKRRNEGCARLLLVIADGGGGVTSSAGRIKYPETLNDITTAVS